MTVGVRPGGRRGRLQPVPPLAQRSVPVPEPAQRYREPGGDLRIDGATPLHRRPEIVMVVLEACQPGGLIRSSEVSFTGLREVHEVLGVAAADPLHLTAGDEAIQGVLANGVQLPVPVDVPPALLP